MKTDQWSSQGPRSLQSNSLPHLRSWAPSPAGQAHRYFLGVQRRPTAPLNIFPGGQTTEVTYEKVQLREEDAETTIQSPRLSGVHGRANKSAKERQTVQQVPKPSEEAANRPTVTRPGTSPPRAAKGRPPSGSKSPQQLGLGHGTEAPSKKGPLPPRAGNYRRPLGTPRIWGATPPHPAAPASPLPAATS